MGHGPPSRWAEAPHTSLLLWVSAAARHPEAQGRPRRTRILCSAPELPRARGRGRAEQSRLFSRKITFPRLPLWFGTVQQHRAPTRTRSHCLLCPGRQKLGWGEGGGVSGTLPAGAQWPRSARAQRQHRQPAVLQGTVPAAPGEAQWAHADADPGSAAVPNPEPFLPLCIVPLPGDGGVAPRSSPPWCSLSPHPALCL